MVNHTNLSTIMTKLSVKEKNETLHIVFSIVQSAKGGINIQKIEDDFWETEGKVLSLVLKVSVCLSLR